MTEEGTVIIATPVGEDIFVDGVKVGTVGAPVTETGKLRITTAPVGARVYTKRLSGYIYAGLSPQTLTLAASAVPVLVKVTKAEFSDVHDIVYIVPNETVSKSYAMERIAIEEPEETAVTLKVMSHPTAELFLYMEGAEGFIPYGKTPQTLTLKARTGAWVPMAEAKRALSETRLSAIENERVRTEDARRVARVDAAQEAYANAKEERREVESTLYGFRRSYNLFQQSFNTFFRSYLAYTAQLDGAPNLWAAEKARWDMDNRYWTDILLAYEQRRQVCRVYEDQMKHEWEEAKLRARAPFWLPTPGMKGVMWHLKLEKPGYRTEVDEFRLEPGRPTTKDYAMVKILDVTTPESLAPLIINTPRPRPPDMPFAFAWLFILPWPEGNVWVFDKTANRIICGPKETCAFAFIKVKPGRRKYMIQRHSNQQVTLTLDIAPGETRYVQVDMIPLTEAQRAAKRAAQAAGGDWLSCGGGASGRSRFETTKAAGRVG